MFNTLTTNDSIKSQGDTLGGGKAVVFDSGLYDMTVKLAYGSLSAQEAVAVNLVLENEDGKNLKQQLWVSSNKQKGRLNYYMTKDPKNEKNMIKKYLPGFELADALCLMTLGKGLSDTGTEKKTIMLYSFDEKKEVPTEVNMIMELLGKKITVGVIKQLVNKRVKDPKSGEYVSITETKEENEIDKFFHFPSGLTVTEAQAKATEPVFKQKWAEKWTGQIKDKTTDDAIPDPTKNDEHSGNKTTPSKSTPSLFGGAATA